MGNHARLWNRTLPRSARIRHSRRLPAGPFNSFIRFISPNPKTTFTPVQRLPKINRTAFLGPFTSVIGDVSIKKNVFIAPSATLRADEGTPFSIGSNTNIQDDAILHGLAKETIRVGSKRYSIFIGKGASIAHGGLLFTVLVISGIAYSSASSLLCLMQS